MIVHLHAPLRERSALTWLKSTPSPSLVYCKHLLFRDYANIIGRSDCLELLLDRITNAFKAINELLHVLLVHGLVRPCQLFHQLVGFLDALTTVGMPSRSTKEGLVDQTTRRKREQGSPEDRLDGLGDHHPIVGKVLLYLRSVELQLVETTRKGKERDERMGDRHTHVPQHGGVCEE